MLYPQPGTHKEVQRLCCGLAFGAGLVDYHVFSQFITPNLSEIASDDGSCSGISPTVSVINGIVSFYNPGYVANQWQTYLTYVAVAVVTSRDPQKLDHTIQADDPTSHSCVSGVTKHLCRYSVCPFPITHGISCSVHCHSHHASRGPARVFYLGIWTGQ